MKLALQDFDIREADWETDKNVLLNLRKLVFIVEQSVPPEEEFDGLDDTSWHWLVKDKQGRPIGTGRLLSSGQIGRMAVLEAHRGKGIGAAVLGTVIEKARTLGFEQVFLNAQVHALGFYEKAGFTETGEQFAEAGIAHQKMTQQLDPLRHDRQQ
jgi:predicted GNAT family N-acyltransferase